ncbi:hypothetical protein ANN_18243 [Periplaneta americana]|uniref:Uncharacterized protein n=1 Tax=Periplaneta americana TaxID=6978 RepID=A0ABQ8SN75_PERAM|nr:hypothetical protein ANN_18243 [Periplaneta americana]
MSPGFSTESYPAFAHIGLRENTGINLNQGTCPDRESNPDHLVSRPDALTKQQKLTAERTRRDRVRNERGNWRTATEMVWHAVVCQGRKVKQVKEVRAEGSWIECGLVLNSLALRCPHKKKSRTVRSVDRAGQLISPNREIVRPGKKFLNNRSVSLAIWALCNIRRTVLSDMSQHVALQILTEFVALPISLFGYFLEYERLALRNARWFESSWGKKFSHEMAPVPTQHRDAGSYDRLRTLVANASYNGWGDHRANHTIPPFWLDDRPPLLRHVGVRPAAGWSV